MPNLADHEAKLKSEEEAAKSSDNGLLMLARQFAQEQKDLFKLESQLKYYRDIIIPAAPDTTDQPDVSPASAD